MRSLLVVVFDVLPEDSGKVALAQDQDVIQTLSPYGSHETFGDSVCFRRAYRSADDLHCFRTKHLMEGSRVLGVPVMDQETGFSGATLDD